MRSLINETSRCVKCGLCLAACPTYGIYNNEAYSPRGRIALIAAAAKQELNIDDELDQRLDSCLLCGTCEKSCPSKVNFISMMDEARVMTRPHRPFWLRPLIDYLIKPKHQRRMLKLQVLVSSTPSYRLLIKQSRDPNIDTVPGFVPGEDPVQGNIGLFAGCTSHSLEPDALDAAIKLLTAAGYNVFLNSKNSCCGALHAHTGEQERAASLLDAGLAPFKQLELDAVVSITSGCALHLRKHTDLPFLDIYEVLAESRSLSRFQFAPIAGKVALQIPCTLENSPGGAKSLISLLQRIPEINLAQIGEGHSCCGAAGTYFLSHPRNARQLRIPYIEELEACAPKFLLSSNIGCALHIARGLKAEPLEILHPLTLLTRALQTPNSL